MGVVTSSVLIGASLASTAISGMNKYNTAQGASAMAEAQGYSDKLTSERMIRNAEEMQRQERGIERSRAYASDSGAGQDQSLMSLAFTENQQALEIAEMQLQGKAAVRRARTKSLLYQDEAKASIVSTAGSLASQGYKGYHSIMDARD